MCQKIDILVKIQYINKVNITKSYQIVEDQKLKNFNID